MFTLYMVGVGMDVLQNSIAKRIRKEAKLGLEFIRMWPCIVHRTTGPQKPTDGVCSFSTFTVRDFKNKQKKKD